MVQYIQDITAITLWLKLSKWNEDVGHQSMKHTQRGVIAQMHTSVQELEVFEEIHL